MCHFIITPDAGRCYKQPQGERHPGEAFPP